MAGEAQRRIGTLAVRSTPQSETLLRRPICDRHNAGRLWRAAHWHPAPSLPTPADSDPGGLRSSLRVSRRVWATARSRWQKKTRSLMTYPYPHSRCCPDFARTPLNEAYVCVGARMLLNQGNVCLYGYRTGAIIKDPLSPAGCRGQVFTSGRRAGAVQNPSISSRMRSTTFGWTLGRSIPVPKPTWSPSSVEVHLSVSPQASRSV